MTSTAPRIEDLMAQEAWLRRLVAQLVDADEIDDVIQDTWAAALEQSDRAVQRPRAWLAGVARNLAFRRRRSAARTRRREAAAARDESVPSTDEMLSKLEAQRQVATAVAELDEPYRTAVLLRFFEEMSPQDIATHLNANASTVRTHIERGIGRVRERLGPRRHAMAALLLTPTAARRTAAAATVKGASWMTTNWKIYGAAAAVLAAFGLRFAFDEEPTPRAAGPAAPGIAASATTDERSEPSRATPERAARRAESTAVADAPPLFTARVIDTSGRPVPGVELTYTERDLVAWSRTPDAPLEDAPIKRQERLGSSAADGRIEHRIAMGHGSLTAGADWLTLFTPSMPHLAQGKDGTVVVARPVELQGVVVDRDGRPLAGVRVGAELGALLDLHVSLEQTKDASLPFTETDANGRFTLRAAPGVPELGLSASIPGFVRVEKQRVEPREHHRLVMAPADPTQHTLSGTVVDAQGRVVPFAVVRLDWDHVFTNQHGAFELSTGELHDESLLLVHKRGHSTTLHPDTLGELRRTGSLTDVELQLGSEARRLEGRVTDPTGRPVRDAIIWLTDAQAIWHSTTAEDLARGSRGDLEQVGNQSAKVDARTDADGRFAVDGLSNRDYRVRVYDGETMVSTAVTARPGEPIEIEFDAGQTRPISGRVLDFSGQPIEDCRVGVVLATFQSETFSTYMAKPSIRTDAAGRFSIEAMPTGDAQIEVSGNGLISSYTDVPETGEVVIRVAHRCLFRIENATGADEFALLDAQGERLTIARRRGSVSTTGSDWDLTNGRSAVLSASQTATSLELIRDGQPISRHPIHLTPTIINVMTPSGGR